jgi:hypothetical protein
MHCTCHAFSDARTGVALVLCACGFVSPTALDVGSLPGYIFLPDILIVYTYNYKPNLAYWYL